jgi:prepilin-type N-terminal cleavage/methylation domain-containing protein
MPFISQERSCYPGGGLLVARSPSCMRCAHAFTLIEMTVVIVVIAALAAMVVGQVDGTLDDAEHLAARATLQTVADACTGSSAGHGYLADMRYAPGFQSQSLRLHDLLERGNQSPFDPVARRGWHGPYLRPGAGVRNLNAARNGAFPAANERRSMDDASFLQRGFYLDAATSRYGEPGDLTVGDPWGNPIVIQVPDAAAFTQPTQAEHRLRFARLVSAGPDGVLTTPLDRLAGLAPDGTKPLRGDDLVQFLNRSDVYEPEEP